MRLIADFAYLLAGLLYLPVALYQAIVLGKNRHGWRERFGFVRRYDSDRPRIWIHAVSLGEINATPRLVEALRARRPDVEIVFSTTTDTGYARGVQLYGADRVFRFPLDFSLVIARVLKRVRPSLIVLVELEVWYNLVRMATRRGVPVAVVNGRLTERSRRRFGKLGGAVRSMFSDLAWVGAQDESIAGRFRELGAARNRVEVTSSMKWDTATVCDGVDGAEALGRALGIGDSTPLWVCGSTGPGEEVLLLDTYRHLVRATNEKAPVLAIVPRKPERFDEVARLIERRGFACVRRSVHGDDNPASSLPGGGVVLGDTMGELRKFYSLADVVFVGRSLVPMGGSDPMEVAALGKPIIIGPYTGNFRLPVEALLRAEAIRVVESSDELRDALAAVLQDGALAEALGRHARQVVLDHQGATQRTADGLVRLLGA